MSDSIVALFSIGFVAGVLTATVLIAIWSKGDDDLGKRKRKGIAQGNIQRIRLVHTDSGFLPCDDTDVDNCLVGNNHGQEHNRRDLGYCPWQE